MILEDPPGLGERHGPPEPIEQPRPQLPLQLGHVLRQRGLAQVQDLRRAAEALGPRHSQEDLELPEAERHKPGLIEEIRTRDWTLFNQRASLGVNQVFSKEARP